jgi:PST family polysaccharide transporter
MSIIKAIKWSFVGELATKILQPLTFLISMKFLTPTDYGVITSALMLIGFSQIFWEAGLGKTLIQRQNNILEGTHIHFWINFVFGIIISLILIVSSEIISTKIYNNTNVANVLKAMTLHIIFSSISSVYLTILQKEMQFKKIFWVKIITVAVPTLISIPFVLIGFGYWAVIIGSIVGQFLQFVLLIFICDYKPKLNFNFTLAKEMANFSIWVMFTSALTWFYVWADSMIIGMYLGTTEMGLYRNGGIIASMIFVLILGPLTPVLYSYLSSISSNLIKVKEISSKLTDLLILVTIPISIFGYFYSNEICEIIFNEKWIGIGYVVSVMFLMHGFSWLVGYNGEFYRAIGKPSYETIITASLFVVYLISYIISIKLGLKFFVWIRFLLSILALILHLGILKFSIGFDVKKFIINLILILFICILSIVSAKYFIDLTNFNKYLKLSFKITSSLLLTTCLILMTSNKKIIFELISKFK